jgi:hypothetical protein
MLRRSFLSSVPFFGALGIVDRDPYPELRRFRESLPAMFREMDSFDKPNDYEVAAVCGGYDGMLSEYHRIRPRRVMIGAMFLDDDDSAILSVVIWHGRRSFSYCKSTEGGLCTELRGIHQRLARSGFSAIDGSGFDLSQVGAASISLQITGDF